MCACLREEDTGEKTNGATLFSRVGVAMLS
jgi:hypothetical protein